MKAFPLILVGVLGLAACNREGAPTNPLPSDPSTAKAGAAGESANSASATSNPNVSLTVEPAAVSACDESKRLVADVKWSVNEPGVSTVRLEVNSSQDPERKNFAAGGAVGEAKTGEWVNAGVVFHLVDAATGKELTSYEVKSEPCTTPAQG